jgi:hypothetical protein
MKKPQPNHTSDLFAREIGHPGTTVGYVAAWTSQTGLQLSDLVYRRKTSALFVARRLRQMLEYDSKISILRLTVEPETTDTAQP